MAASFSLIIEDDAGKQIVVPFAKDVITIGRKEGNTIRLTERNVSRFHAKLERQQAGIVVEDLSSFNGIKLNGDRIAGKVLVSAGDVIEIGDYHLELRAAHAQAAAQKPLGPVGSRSGALPEQNAGDDEFEGDTQRWEPPPASSSPPTQEDTVPHLAASPFADSNGDTERLDLQHLRNIASQGGQAVAPPPLVGEPQSWPPPTPRPPPPLAPMDFPAGGAVEFEPTARQPTAPMAEPSPSSAMTMPLPAAPAPSPPSLPPPPPPPPAPPPAAALPVAATPMAATPMAAEPTMDMPLPASLPRAPASSPNSAPPRRRVEETEQLRAAPPAPSPADDLALPRLVVLNTIFSGSTFALRAVENVIGRTDDNDIVVEHRSVSRNHAKIVREGDRVRILDLKSANGVLVNGEEVEQHILKSGDIIELGRLRIRFVAVGERFVVAPDEIERARIADAAGEDFDNGSQTVNVTNPLRGPVPSAPVVQKQPVILYAILVVLAIVVIILAGLVISGRGSATPPTAVGSLPAPAEPVAAPPVEAEGVPVESVVAVPAEPAAVAVAEAPPAPEAPEAPEASEASATQPPKSDSALASSKKPKPKTNTDDQLLQARKALLGGEYSLAIKLLKQVEQVTPNDPLVHRSLGVAYAHMKRQAEARRHYARYVELAPNSPDVEEARKLATSR